MSDSPLPGFHISDEDFSNLDEKTIESIAQIVIRTMLGELPEYHPNLVSFNLDEEDEEEYVTIEHLVTQFAA